MPKQKNIILQLLEDGYRTMFITFFYLLRAKGLEVSLKEWLTLTEALDKGLCGASLLDFYQLCRSILVKSESEYDKFDLAFAEYFKEVETIEDIPDEVWRWLDVESRLADMQGIFGNALEKYELDQLLKLLKERLEEQKEKHNGGSYWVGTDGTSHLGHSGYQPGGIRVGGQSHHRSAVKIAGERNFKDFRGDNILDTRQFQMAFRKLREFSSRIESAKTELDLEKTVQKTSDNAGRLKLVFEKPRRNTVKLLLLFDSDGSMTMHARLCSVLFQAVTKSNHFKDLQTYYFHNCIYEHLYTDPYCRKGNWVDTDWVFNNLSSEYKVIIVGDASMAPSELLRKGGNSFYHFYNEITGIAWLKKVRKKYPHSVWLNPIKRDYWEHEQAAFTMRKIREVFPMFELSLEGIEAAIKKLIVSR